MVRFEQLEIEVDSLVKINEDLSVLNLDYFNQSEIDKRAIENLKKRVVHYKDYVVRDSIQDVKIKKDNKKKRVKQGIVAVSAGIIVGLLLSLL
jgi:hypothetical protein